MPLYEYQCSACRGRFEMIQKFSESPPDACRLCGRGPVERLLSSPAIQFKGSGWYITDYARKGQAEKKPGDSGDAATGDAKSDAKADSAHSETKTSSAAKPDTAAKSDKPTTPASGS